MHVHISTTSLLATTYSSERQYCASNEETGDRMIALGGVWFEELKFNEHCSIFVLFDKKISILD
jgi:hypothetical protein